MKQDLGLFYSSIILLVLISLYYIIATVFFILWRHRKPIRARTPWLVIITPIGQFVDAYSILLMTAFFSYDISIVNFSLYFQYSCIKDQLLSSIVELFISIPIFLRFHYIYRVNLLVSAFDHEVEKSIIKA